jgi:hypothetical protein
MGCAGASADAADEGGGSIRLDQRGSIICVHPRQQRMADPVDRLAGASAPRTTSIFVNGRPERRTIIPWPYPLHD